MRERLKREIAPLLSCNRNKDLSGKNKLASSNAANAGTDLNI